MAYTGTEEMARFAPGFNYTGGDHQNYLRQLNRFGDTDLELIRERGAEDARHELAYQDRLGQAIGAGYQGYRQGKGDAYNYAQAEENLASSRLQNQDAASEMEAKNKLYDPNQAPGAMSGREFGYYNQGTNAANNQLGYGQNKGKAAWSEEKGADGRTNLARGLDLAMQTEEHGLKNSQLQSQVYQRQLADSGVAARERKLNEAAELLSQLKTQQGGIDRMGMQRVQRELGLSNQDLQIAMGRAQKRSYSDLLLEQQSPGYQPYFEQVDSLAKANVGLEGAIAAAKSYREGKEQIPAFARMFGWDKVHDSDTSANAVRQFADYLRSQGKDEQADDVESGIPSTAGRTTQVKMATYLKQQMGDHQTRLGTLQNNTSYSNKAEVQNLQRQIERLQALYAQTAQGGQQPQKNTADIKPMQPMQQGQQVANQQFFQPQATGMAGMPQPMPGPQPGQPMNFRHHSVGQQQFVNQAPGMPPAQVQPQFAPGAFQNLPNQNRGGM